MPLRDRIGMRVGGRVCHWGGIKGVALRDEQLTQETRLLRFFCVGMAESCHACGWDIFRAWWYKGGAGAGRDYMDGPAWGVTGVSHIGV